MNQRLQQFLAAENISQAQFADTIEVARASVSHVLAGRNKPGYEFIKSIADSYPQLNLEWLISGKGKMYKMDPPAIAFQKQEEKKEEESFRTELFAPEEEQNDVVQDVKAEKSASISKSDTSNNTPQVVNNQRTIEKIVIFYSDNTYQELK